jgi:hypothetical protein
MGRRTPALLRRGLGLAALGPWLVALAAGCEALVDGQLGPIACEAEGQVGPPACPTGFECKAGACAPASWGAACATDADCLPTECCLDPSVLGGAGAMRCTRVCCSSSDCDPDPSAVCWIPPNGGGSFCRAASDVGLDPPGTGEPLSPCSGDGACRSARCSDGLCQDTCCTDTTCAPNGACRLSGPPTAEALGFWCGAAPGTAAIGAPCKGDADCASGLCLEAGTTTTDIPGPVCSTPCCSSEDCGLFGGVPARCVMLEGPHAGVRACVPGGAVGTEEVGVACLQDSDCRSGMCVTLAGRMQCTDLCCSDDSCGESRADEVCRPTTVDGAWALRCAPK